MFNQRIITIIKRELRDKLFSKSFIIMTLLVPVFIFGILAFQTFIQMYNSDESLTIQVAANSPKLVNKIKEEFTQQEFIKNGHYRISYEVVQDNQFDEYLDTLKGDLLAEKINGLIYIPDSSLTDKNIGYYSKVSKNFTLFSKLGKLINNVFVDMYFQGKNLSDDEISYARSGVEFNPFRISEDQVEKEGYGNQIVSFLLSFLLYMSLLILGQMMLRNVVQEKANKVVEVLLSSASSRELMVGKITGTTITGVLQMIIWMLPLIFIITTSWFVLPPELIISLDISKILFFILTFGIALVTYLGLFAAAGAAVDNDQDAQSMMWPMIMLIMIPFFISISLQTNPENIIGKVASFIPFASLIVMPVRVALVDVSFIELLASVVINILTLIFIVNLSGKIYRVGILITGKKPKLGELINWIKES